MFDTIHRVYELAEERHITAYSFCQQTGIGYHTLRAAERRKGQLKLESIEQICAIAGISFGEFFNAEPAITKEEIEAKHRKYRRRQAAEHGKKEDE